MTTPSYAGRVIVMTGASSGFGLETSRELARRGAHLVLAARSERTLNNLADECRSLGGRAVAVPTDVSAPEAVVALGERAVEAFGHFDVWINDAGAAAIGRFDDVPLEDHLQVVRTSLEGTMSGSHCALRHFRDRGEGVLINIASVLGKIPAPLYASYAAAKFGVVGLCDALRQELGLEDLPRIRVCTVMPMAHSTEFFEHAANYTGRAGAPLPPVYDPQVTVDALVKLVVEPEDELITGPQGVMFNLLHKLMPNAIEKYMAKNTEQTQLREAAPAEPTSGNLYQSSKP